MFKVFPSRTPLLALGILCAVLFFWQLGAYSLFNETEAKQAEIARQIWVQQNWITPYYNGEVYFDKPILLHWLMAIAIALVGLNEWAVRLPSAIAATVLVLATYGYISRLESHRVGWLTALFLAANPFTFALGRTGQHDMVLVCFWAIALYSWYVGYVTGRRGAYLLFFGAMALATLAKGPLAIVLGGLTIGGFVAWVGRWRTLVEMPWGWGGVIFGAIVLPWYGLMTTIHGWTFIAQFLGYNNVDRFLRPNLQQSAPVYFYGLLLAAGFFPWHGLLPAIALAPNRWHQWHPAHWRRISAQGQLPLFMGIWLGGVVGFMSIAATKLPWYVYPGVPPLAYLCARGWDAYSRWPGRTLAWQLWAIAAIYAAGAAGLVWLPQRFADVPVVQEIAATRVPYLWALVFAVNAVVVALSGYHRRIRLAAVSSAIAFTLIALTIVNPFMPALDRAALAAKTEPIVRTLRQAVHNDNPEVVPIALGIKDPTFNFYSRIDKIRRIDNPKDLVQLLKGGKPLLIITRQKVLREMDLDISHKKPLVSAGDYWLFRVPSGSDA